MNSGDTYIKERKENLKMGIGKLVAKSMSYFGKSFTRTGARMEKAAAKHLGTGVKSGQTAAVNYRGKSLSELVANQPKTLPMPTSEQILASYPRVNTGKVLGRNLDELSMTQVVKADGTHVRYYRNPGSDKLLMKTEDKGILHKETIFDYKNGGDRLIFKQIGDDKTFVHSTLNSVQNKKDKKRFKDGIWQRVSEDDLYIRFGEKGRIHRSRTKGVNGQFNENVEVANVASSKLYQGPYKVKSEFNHFVDNEKINTVNYVLKNCESKSTFLNRVGYDGTAQFEKHITEIDNALKRYPMTNFDDLCKSFKQ